MGRAFATFISASPFEPHSPEAAAIAVLFRSTLLICAAIFALVSGLIAFCVLRFRATGTRDPAQVEGNRRLEIAWTVAPVLILSWLLVLTARAMNASDPPADHPPDVTIIAHQWWWEARYPSGAIAANEIHIPTGKSLVFRIDSADVIHDFWVPELGRKIDAVPGRPRDIWLQADAPGEYTGACAEYCGAQHAWMRIRVVADLPEKFEEWQQHQLLSAPAPNDELVARGASTFQAMTCVSCHRIGGGGGNAQIAPDLTHFAQRATIGAGVLPNTPSSLTLWLQNPQAIKEGCHMPNAQLTGAQIAELVAYFETLQ